MLALGLASYLTLYPALLFPPLALLCYDRQITGGKKPNSVIFYSARHFLIFASSVALLLFVSYFISGNSWEFIPATYGVQLLVPDLTPNAGLWWYFFIELFDPFREFFLGVFWLHLAAYVGGLTARIRRQPLFVITTLLGLFAIFKPYPSISDVSLYFAVLPLYRHVFPCMCFSFSFAARNLYGPKMLTIVGSNAVYLLCRLSTVIFHASWPSVPPFVDICRVRQCQFLLCNHAGLESRVVDPRGRLVVRRSQRRMGKRTSRNERQGRQADLITQSRRSGTSTTKPLLDGRKMAV